MIVPQYVSSRETQQHSMCRCPSLAGESHCLARVDCSMFSDMVDNSPLVFGQRSINLWTNYRNGRRIYPHTSLSNVVSQRDPNTRMIDFSLSKLWGRQFRVLHKLQHSLGTLVSALHKIDEPHSGHQMRVSWRMCAIDVFRRNGWRKRTRALDFQSIVEHLNKDRHVLERAV